MFPSASDYMPVAEWGKDEIRPSRRQTVNVPPKPRGASFCPIPNPTLMENDVAVRAAERNFFSALLSGDQDVLERALADDFILIDVIHGNEVAKPDLLAAIALGQVRFEGIEPGETRLRFYGDTAIVTGSTRMSFRFGENAEELSSRYTHIYVRMGGAWRLVSAQGTPIRTF
jgi:ketosteroid isomerase-like protein